MSPLFAWLVGVDAVVVSLVGWLAVRKTPTALTFAAGRSSLELNGKTSREIEEPNSSQRQLSIYRRLPTHYSRDGRVLQMVVLHGIDRARVPWELRC